MDSVQPVSGWWMYEILAATEVEESKGSDILQEYAYAEDEAGRLC